jgi:hypothetical protein
LHLHISTPLYLYISTSLHLCTSAPLHLYTSASDVSRFAVKLPKLVANVYLPKEEVDKILVKLTDIIK